MTVGFLQFAPVLGDRAATLARITRLLAHEKVPDLLVLPELCNSGYNFRDHRQAHDLAETITGSAFLEFLHGVCQRTGIHVVTGFDERDGDRLFNTAVLLGPPGVIGTYRKLHLFLNEKDHFHPGDLGLPVFDFGFMRVGMLVCFDWIFPEVWRVLALQGADVICLPANLVLPGLAQRGVVVRALENRVFVVLANRTGAEGDLQFTGCSMIVHPGGDTMMDAGPTDECLRLAEIDVAAARNKAITPRNDVLADRRPGEYRLLTET